MLRIRHEVRQRAIGVEKRSQLGLAALLVVAVVASRSVCLVNSSVKMLSSVFPAFPPVAVAVGVAIVVAIACLFTRRHTAIDLGLQCASAWNETQCPAPGLAAAGLAHEGGSWLYPKVYSMPYYSWNNENSFHNFYRHLVGPAAFSACDMAARAWQNNTRSRISVK